jgi:hypothetical protein
MTTPLPDLEIYILKSTAADVQPWLTAALGPLESIKSGADSQHWRVNGMDILFNEKAEGSFSCLWFKQNLTPWATDLECARAAYAALQTEIRCAAEQWAESSPQEQPGWIKITHGQEKQFDWN